MVIVRLIFKGLGSARWPTGKAKCLTEICEPIRIGNETPRPRMRYIDSGSRTRAEALGAWLEKNVLHDHELQQLRWQSGFFSADALGYFAAPMSRLRTFDGVFHALIGSNDSKTSVADAKALLAAAGAPRKNQQLGIVQFANAYFHPKTIHIVRKNKSSAAYVGSANLTGPGLTGMHVEAGLLLDTDKGDELAIAIDALYRRFGINQEGVAGNGRGLRLRCLGWAASGPSANRRPRG
jgi:hypothetical protein